MDRKTPETKKRHKHKHTTQTQTHTHTHTRNATPAPPPLSPSCSPRHRTRSCCGTPSLGSLPRCSNSSAARDHFQNGRKRCNSTRREQTRQQETRKEKIFRSLDREGEGSGGCTLCQAPGRSRVDHRPSRPYKSRDAARRVFTDQADIACTKHEAPS